MAEFFVRRPIVAMVIAIVTMIRWPGRSSGPANRPSIPEITPPMVSVSASYIGANATNVEQSVATPIEQKVNGVENMLYMKSTNSSDGRMNAGGLVRGRHRPRHGQRADPEPVSPRPRPLLPEEVKRQGVTVKKKLSFPLLLLSMVSPNGTYDETLPDQLRHDQHHRRARPHPRRRPGGGSGAASPSTRCASGSSRTSSRSSTSPSRTSGARSRSRTCSCRPGRSAGRRRQPGTEFTYTVQTAGRFETAEEFGKVVVRSNRTARRSCCATWRRSSSARRTT